MSICAKPCTSFSSRAANRRTCPPSRGWQASALLGLADRVVLQEALESEQRDAVGRERCQRGADGRYRSGYRPGYVESAEGHIRVEVPRVRGIAGYRSTLMDVLGDHSEVLEPDARTGTFHPRH